MKMKTRPMAQGPLWQGAILLFLTFIAFPAISQENIIVFYPDKAEHQISRHIYGHFSEHLGRCIYGGIWVEEGAEIPNQGRIRTDVVEALKEIAIPNLRWPGGCFADEYHWRDGIGPIESRPTIINTHWGGVTEDNSFGTHEFIELCRQLDTEPVICGNVGSGTVQEMSQWIEYLNSANTSPMTNLRKENGHPDPFNVKYFGIGNEVWGCGGHMTAEYYANELRRYSTYCRDYGDNRLYRVACGASDGNYQWTETLMKNASRFFQGISLHYYTRSHTESWSYKGSATDFNESEWFSTMANTLKMEDFVKGHSAIMDKYDPEKRKGLIVDEWGNWHDVEPGSNPGFLFQQNTLRDALVAGINLDIFNNHCERVKMANIAQVVNVLQSVVLTDGPQLVKTPTFYVFKMYKVHHDATMVPHEIISKAYNHEGQGIQAIHTSCSKAEDGTLHVTMTNLDPDQPATVDCTFQGIGSVKVLRGEVITAAEMNALNDFGKPEEVNIQPFNGHDAKGNRVTIEMPAKSVVMVALRPSATR